MNDEPTCYCFDCAEGWRVAWQKSLHEAEQLRRQLLAWQLSAEMFRTWVHLKGLDKYKTNSASLRNAINAYEEACHADSKEV